MKIKLTVFFAIIFVAKGLSQDVLIRDINIIPMSSDTLHVEKSILIQNGKIKQIGDYKDLPKNNETDIIDGKGKFLMPGLADMHVHLPEDDKIENLLLANIAAGVTQIRIMNSKASQLELKKQVEAKKYLVSPNIHISHIIRRGEIYSKDRADSLMKQIKLSKIDFIKLFSVTDKDTFNNLTDSAEEHGVIICGHYPVYLAFGKAEMHPMEEVLGRNFKSIEHLAGYNWISTKEELDSLIHLTKEKRIFNCPTLDWDVMAYDLQYPEAYKNRLTYQFLPKKLTHNWEERYLFSIEEAGGEEKVLQSRDGYKSSFDLKIGILKKLYENDCLLLIGGDAGNSFQADGFNVYEEMIHWSNVGIDNFTILKSATVTPSLFFGQSSAWGTIEVGKNAEMIILTKNPLEQIKNITTIEKTIVGGFVYNNEELLNQIELF